MKRYYAPNVIITHFLYLSGDQKWAMAYIGGSGSQFDITAEEAFHYIQYNALRAEKTIISSVSIQTAYFQQ